MLLTAALAGAIIGEIHGSSWARVASPAICVVFARALSWGWIATGLGMGMLLWLVTVFRFPQWTAWVSSSTR